MNTEKSQPKTLTAEKFIEKLRQALRREGDFPASAKVVGKLRQLTMDPKTTANNITEIILREPSLSTRILHLVNSSFYQRAKPIMTVSQAVVQIGMKPLAELCSGLILLQKFVPAARKDSAFAQCLQKSIATSLLSSSINSQVNAQRGAKSEETGYLAGSFAELGTLLLAFYFPQIYQSAVKRSELKQQELGQSIADITGLTPLQLSLEVLDALDLPSYYREVLETTNQLTLAKSNRPSEDRSTTYQAAQALVAAQSISNVVVTKKNRADLDKTLTNIHKFVGLSDKVLGKVIGDLPKLFSDHCSSIELDLPSLPEFVSTYSDTPPTIISEGEENKVQINNSDQFNQFVEEIRDAVENREPTSSIITTVMETLAWGLGFDRVLLLLTSSTNKNVLKGRMLLGDVPGCDPKKIERYLDQNSFGPDIQAFKDSKTVFKGDPILENGWPLAAIPIGLGQRAIGVIYADRIDQDKELNGQEQAAIGVLAELLDRSASMNMKS